MRMISVLWQFTKRVFGVIEDCRKNGDVKTRLKTYMIYFLLLFNFTTMASLLHRVLGL